MKPIKETVASTKKFVYDHRVAIAITLTSIAWYKLNRSAVRQYDSFLKEHNLYEAFYSPLD